MREGCDASRPTPPTRFVVEVSDTRDLPPPSQGDLDDCLRASSRRSQACSYDDLSPAGIERATLLARMLAESGIRAAYCSDVVRTQLTIKPLKKLLGANLEVVVVPTTGAGGVDAHMQQIVDAVKALPDDAVAAVVGHSNTVGPVVEGITGRTIDPIADGEFDKLFVVSVPAAGAATIAPLRYGRAT